MGASHFLNANAAHTLAHRRVLVTGGSGFIGSHFIRQGLAAGVEMHVLGRRPGPAGSHHHLADLNNATRVAAIVAQVAPHVVVNLALPGFTSDTGAFRENLKVAVLGTEALLSACVELPRHPRVLHIGSGFEYRGSDQPVDEDSLVIPASSPYGAVKTAASAVVSGYARSLSIFLLRPFYIYGAGESARRFGPFVVTRSKAGDPVEVTGCEQVRDMVHVDDCATCLWMAAGFPGEDPGIVVLNIGTGKATSLRTYVEALVSALATRDIIADIRFGALPYRQGDPMINLANGARIKSVLGWQPRVTLTQGAADLVRWSLEL